MNGYTMSLPHGSIISISWILCLQLASFVSGEVQILYGSSHVVRKPNAAELPYVIDQVKIYLSANRRLGSSLTEANAYLRITGSNINVLLPIDGECWGYDFLCETTNTCLAPRDQTTCSCTDAYRKQNCPLSTKDWLKGLWIAAAVIGGIFLVASLVALIIYLSPTPGEDEEKEEAEDKEKLTTPSDTTEKSRSLFSPGLNERAANDMVAPTPYSFVPEDGYDTPDDPMEADPVPADQGSMPAPDKDPAGEGKDNPVFYTPTSGSPSIRHIEPSPPPPPPIQPLQPAQPAQPLQPAQPAQPLQPLQPLQPPAPQGSGYYTARDPPYVTRAYVTNDYRNIHPGMPGQRTFNEGYRP